MTSVVVPNGSSILQMEIKEAGKSSKADDDPIARDVTNVHHIGGQSATTAEAVGEDLRCRAAVSALVSIRRPRLPEVGRPGELRTWVRAEGGCDSYRPRGERANDRGTIPEVPAS